MRKRKSAFITILTVIVIAFVWFIYPAMAKDNTNNKDVKKSSIKATASESQVSEEEIAAALKNGEKLKKALKYNSSVSPAQRQKAADSINQRKKGKEAGNE